MDEPLGGISRFFRELKRRNVYKVAVTYVVVAFVGLEAVDLLIPATTLPAWADEFLVALAVFGFPVAIVLAWGFEMTPEGVRRTPDAAEKTEAGAPSRTGQSLFAMKVLVGLGLVGAAVAGGWYLAGGGGESPEIAEQTVAVLPFEVTGTGTEDWREGMVTMVSTGLDGAAGLRAIADRTVLSAWHQRGQAGQGASTGEALAVARQIGVQYAVIGSAGGLGSELRFVAAVHDTETGDRLGQVEVRGSPDSVTALADDLTRRVIGLLAEGTDERLRSADLAAVTTQSVAALKAYLEGERHSRAGEFAAAVDDYRSAVARDSSFALAFWQLYNVTGWVDPGSGTRFLRRAFELADRLPRRERRLLRATHLSRREGHSLSAADSLRRLSQAYPDDPRIWYELGRLIFHAGIPGGWPEADEAFGRAIDLDPGHARYQVHYLQLGIAFHHDSALAAERWAKHPSPGSIEPWFPLSMDLAFGAPERRREAGARVDAATAREDLRLGSVAYSLSHPKDGDMQEKVLRRAAAVSGDAAPLVHNLLRRGRLDEVLAALPSVPSDVVVACGLADAVSLGYPVPDSVVRARILSPARASDASVERLLCAAVVQIQRGQSQEVARWVGRLRESGADTIDGSSAYRVRARNAVQIARGYRAWKAGEVERAARLVAHVMYRPSILVFPWRGLRRGDVHRELGELKTAEGWYLTTWWHPLAHQRLGQLYEDMDKPEKAAAAYRRFIAAWRDADDELQPRVEAARERLQELTASEGAAR